MEDRRRFPRRPLQGVVARVPATLQVRLLDISANGVLLRTNRPIRVGARGALRLSLGGAPFAGEVQVRRVSEEAGVATGYRVGATFVAIRPEDRRLIERFMTQ